VTKSPPRRLWIRGETRALVERRGLTLNAAKDSASGPTWAGRQLELEAVELGTICSIGSIGARRIP